MKYLKKFNESDEMESKIEDYLKTEFPTEWFDSDEVCKEFGIEDSQKFGDRDVNDIVHDHLMDYCTWKDNYVFNRRSTEPYRNPFGFSDSFNDLMKKWDDGDIKL
jgi:hypothetical protein